VCVPIESAPSIASLPLCSTYIQNPTKEKHPITKTIHLLFMEDENSKTNSNPELADANRIKGNAKGSSFTI